MTKYTDDEKKLAQFFVEREGEGVLEELRKMDFVESGILDSLDMVTLSVFIEKTFSRKLDLSNENTFKAARHFDSLMNLIMNKDSK